MVINQQIQIYYLFCNLSKKYKRKQILLMKFNKCFPLQLKFLIKI